MPRHVQIDTVRTLITASSLVPHPVLLPFFPLLRPLVALALRTPLRQLIRVLGDVMGRLRRSEAADSPRPESPQAPSFLIVLEAEGKDFPKTRLVAGGRDCHQATAQILAHGVELLARGQARSCGVLATAEAFEPESFLNQLEDSVNWWKE